MAKIDTILGEFVILEKSENKIIFQQHTNPLQPNKDGTILPNVLADDITYFFILDKARIGYVTVSVSKYNNRWETTCEPNFGSNYGAVSGKQLPLAEDNNLALTGKQKQFIAKVFIDLANKFF